MNREPRRGFGAEFWPKAVILVVLIIALALLEKCGLIRRW